MNNLFMKKILIFLFLFLSLSPKGNSNSLSPQAQISLLTCAPGTEIYSWFGHTAIRVMDPGTGIDYVFNYGVFSFGTKNFAWHFAKGETDYQLAVQRMNSFMQEYHEDLRTVTEIVLDIKAEEKQALYDALIENYKPENRVYRYNHFLDNCATRVRDQFEKAVGGKLKYDMSGDEELSFRNLIDKYVPGNSWSGFGIKLGLGIPTDRKTAFSEKMFLPDYLEADMAKAVVTREKGDVPFTKPQTVLFEASPVKSGFSYSSPVSVVIIFFLIVLGLTYIEYRRKKRMIWLDFLVLFLFGLAGLVIGFLTFFSILEGTRWNLNLIWALPTHILFAFIWLIKPMRKYLVYYLKSTAIVLVLFLLVMFFLPQTFHLLVIPLCLILLLRTGNLFLKKEFY
jgi:hypothetical protein